MTIAALRNRGAAQGGSGCSPPSLLSKGSLRPRNKLVMSIDADVAAFEAVWLAAAVVDQEDGVGMPGIVTEVLALPSDPVVKLLVFPVPSIGVNEIGVVSKWFSNRL